MLWFFAGAGGAEVGPVFLPERFTYLLLNGPHRLARRHGVFGLGDIHRLAPLSARVRGGEPPIPRSGVTMALLLPTNTAGREQLAALGTERSRWLGWVAPNVDVQDGDEWHIGDKVYTVDAADPVPDFVICALSIRRKGA